MRRVLKDIAAERVRQNEKWGEQNHPNVSPVLAGHPTCPINWAYGLHTASAARDICDHRHQEGTGSWTDIVVEELCEAVEEYADDTKLRAELVQTAAVIVAWIECIDRRVR